MMVMSIVLSLLMTVEMIQLMVINSDEDEEGNYKGSQASLCMPRSLGMCMKRRHCSRCDAGLSVFVLALGFGI